jgi:hypothetical protein
MEGGKEAEKKLNEGAEKKRKIAKIIKEWKVENDGGEMTTQQFTQQTDSQLTGVQSMSVARGHYATNRKVAGPITDEVNF